MCKYPKTKGYWVYVHRTPDNMYYPGQSKQQIYQRWKPSNYCNTSLELYIDQYGWDNIEHLVVKDGLTKEQALYWEERLRQMYTEMGCCINNNRSGNCTADMKAYNRQYKQQYNQRPEVKEYRRQYNQQYYQRPEVKEYMRQYHTEHREERLEYLKKWRSTPEGKIYNRVCSFNQTHPDRMTETPKEARDKYLETGYIPSYIKNDDLL